MTMMMVRDKGSGKEHVVWQSGRWRRGISSMPERGIIVACMHKNQCTRAELGHDTLFSRLLFLYSQWKPKQQAAGTVSASNQRGQSDRQQKATVEAATDEVGLTTAAEG